ncbi:MAG TPA: hypothetical protein VH105_11590 [Burkholderiales bacterium]|jgi:hypothetical protein|nr:hypothetical protein [Burkholderiales bacterium]
MNLPAFCAGMLAALLCAAPARAAPVRLDDSLSSAPRIYLRQEWRDTFPVPGRGPDLLSILARASVEVRLKTDSYVGRHARIFLVLPSIANSGALPPDMRIEWRTRGAMHAGIASPGTRTLVYEGRIGATVTGDWFDFFVTADSRTLGSNVQFQPYFELETE